MFVSARETTAILTAYVMAFDVGDLYDNNSATRPAASDLIGESTSGADVAVEGFADGFEGGAGYEHAPSLSGCGGSVHLGPHRPCVPCDVEVQQREP